MSIRTRTSGILVDVKPPVSGAFTPLNLPNLIAWYKADAGVFKDAGITPCANGDSVVQWNDQSGNGYHLGTGATAPIFRTNQRNGLPAVDGTAATRGPDTSQGPRGANPIPWGVGVVSAFCVLEWTGTNSTTDRLLSMGNGTSDATNDGWTVYENNSLTDVRAYNNGDKSIGTITSLTFNEIGTIFDGANNTLYINNVAQTAVAAANTFNANVNFAFGCQVGGALPLAGFLCECVLTKGVLGASDLNNLHSYFLGRWAA